MTRINNEQKDLTFEALRRSQGYQKIIKDHRARESNKTKEMKGKYLK